MRGLGISADTRLTLIRPGLVKQPRFASQGHHSWSCRPGQGSQQEPEGHFRRSGRQLPQPGAMPADINTGSCAWVCLAVAGACKTSRRALWAPQAAVARTAVEAGPACQSFELQVPDRQVKHSSRQGCCKRMSSQQAVLQSTLSSSISCLILTAEPL